LITRIASLIAVAPRVLLAEPPQKKPTLRKVRD
jgi:hypothetical protein